ARVGLQFLQAVQKYRLEVSKPGSEPTRPAFSLYSQYIHAGDDNTPVVAVPLMSLETTRTRLTQLSMAKGSSIVAMPPESAFEAVEEEVVSYLERYTMAEFYQSRYYVLVDIVSRICSQQEPVSMGFFQSFLHRNFGSKSTFCNPLCVVDGYKPVTGSVASDKRREGKGVCEKEGLPLRGTLPLSSIVGTLESMAHDQSNSLSQTHRDALIFAHFIASSYGNVDVTDCTPMLQGASTRSPPNPPAGTPSGMSTPTGSTQTRAKTRNARDFVTAVFTAFEGPSMSHTHHTHHRHHEATGTGGERGGERGTEGERTECSLGTHPSETSLGSFGSLGSPGRSYDAMPESEREREREQGIFRWATEEFVPSPVPDVFPLPLDPVPLVWTPAWDVYGVFPAGEEEAVECIAGIPRSASYLALPTVVDSAMQELGLYDRLRVSRRQLWYCICTMQQAYSSENPYHNSTHATDVTHMAVSMAMAMLRQNPHVFGPLEMFTLILACASHDVEHPGFDNKYLCRTRHPIAVRFNNQSVLENHHAHLGWGLIKESSVIEHFTQKDRQIVRRLFVDLVLETDPSTNFDFSKRNLGLHRAVTWTQWPSVSGAAPLFTDNMDERHVAQTRYTLLALIIKLADLSNPFRPQSVAKVYAECIMREFYKQGDSEMEYCHGVTLANHQDRTQYPSNMSGCQIAFIANLARPLLNLFSATLEAMSGSAGAIGSGVRPPFLDQIDANIEANVAYWTHLRDLAPTGGRHRRVVVHRPIPVHTRQVRHVSVEAEALCESDPPPARQAEPSLSVSEGETETEGERRV
ncbi:3'5'-cyclic nucleotide phosphodiesterase, partial [Kipferlia bialata]